MIMSEAVAPEAPIEMESREEVFRNDKITEADRAAEKINSLSTNIDSLSRSFAESSVNLNAVAKFIQTAKSEIRQAARLGEEVTDLRSNIIQLTNEVQEKARALEVSNAEVATLRQQGKEVQDALREARESIANMRNASQKASERFRVSLTENTELKETLSQKEDSLEALNAQFEIAETQRLNLKNELDVAMKQISELQSTIDEKDSAIARKNEKSQSLASELGVLTRQLSDVQNDKIALEAKLREGDEHLDQVKSVKEQEKRKHDNEVFALRTEIENLNSQWRLAKASFKDASTEARTMRERNRRSHERIEELEQELQEARRAQDEYQEEIVAQSARIKELNLQSEAVMIDLRQEQLQTAELNRAIKRLYEENEKLKGIDVRYASASEQIKELRSLIQEYHLVQKVAESEIDEGLDDNDVGNIVELPTESEKRA